MSETAPYKWYVGEGEEPENYSEGPFDGRDAAVEVGRELFGDRGFTILEAFKDTFAPPTARNLMDEMLDRWADDDMGRDDTVEFEGSTAAVKAAEADLDALLEAWFKRHAAIMPQPWTFRASRNAEFFPPPAKAPDVQRVEG